MKMKIQQLLTKEFDQAYSKLKDEETISGELKFTFSRISKSIKSELTIYTELRDKCIDECSFLDEEGKKVIETVTLPNGKQVQNVKIKDDRVDYLNLTLKELALVEIEIPEILFSSLGETLQKKLTSKDLDYLEFITQ